jgi:hypothetical protein
MKSHAARRLPVFGWFKKKAPPIEESAAYDKGKQFAREVMDTFDGFAKARFSSIREGYLNVFRGNLQDALQQSEAPALTVARIDYGIFLENVNKVDEQLFDEVTQVMHEWLKTAEIIDIRSQTEQLFQKEIRDFTSNLSILGLSLLTDYAVPLKDADVAWRKANPEKALEFPESE